MDRAKRAVEWPPPAAAERNTKKPCCHCDPRSPATGGGVPEISSLLSSLSVAKRHSPSPPPQAEAPLKRPRYNHDAALHAQMRGLEISCETDMEEEDKEEEERDWAGFLPELLRLVCRQLPLADVPRFGAVCRHWRSCAFPVYPADAAPVLLSAALTAAGAVRCYSSYLHKMFVLVAPPLPQGSRVFSAAAGGWVMLKTPSRTVLFANLLDGSVHETPKRENDEGFMCCAPRPRRHDDPKDLGFDVFTVSAGLGTVKIESWGRGSSWKSFEKQSWLRMSFCCSPVMHKGMLYCLGQEGGLGVYDPGASRWRELPEPAGLSSKFSYKNCYLVESQGELLAVLTGSNGAPPIYVLRLDEAEMVWKRVESLGGRSLFTGTTSSLLVHKPAESMANKVYLPRFYGRLQVIQAELADSDGRLLLVAKEAAEPEQQGSAAAAGHGDDGRAWCYDMESDSGGQFAGSKNLLQYVWVHLGRGASPSPDDDGMVID